MVEPILLLVVGIAVLWGGSELIIRSIGPLARVLGVKELVVTVLGVSVLSSLPELTVSAFAIARGAGDISLGKHHRLKLCHPDLRDGCLRPDTTDQYPS